jgi:two-component system NtrC family sensor kinase
VALFAIAIAVLLKRFAARLIDRISILTNHFVETHLDKISMLPADPHEDELAGLREVSNRMLSSMQASKRELVGFQFVKDVFDSLRDSVCVVDENDRAIIQFNPSFLRMLAATGVDCQAGDSLPGVLARGGFVIDLEALLGAGTGTQGIEIEVGTEEAFRSYMVSSWRTQLNGRSVILVAFADITALSRIKKEKHEIELQLMHASKLTSLGTMGAGLAHELNNPLASIIGFTSVLLKEGLSRERQVEALEKIQRNAARMNRVISHMRSFARDSRTTEKRACKIDGPIQSAFMVLETELKVNSIVVDISLSKRDLVFMGSSTEIESVIQNLISNSRDAFLSQGAQPHGSVRNISLGVEQCGKEIVLRFQDNAGGIPEATRGRIFEPFFTTKDVGKGTGIGLSLSCRFIQDHGGSIACDCPMPGVTEFEIRLPLLESRERIIVPDQVIGLVSAESDFDMPLLDSGSDLVPSLGETGNKTGHKSQRPRIAWIDDEVNILELVSEILEDRFDLETFSDPELAVEQVLRHPPDLVVTDIRMPKKSGFQVVALIRSHFKELPILVASGHASNDRDALEIQTAGAQGLIPKPFPSERELFESISFFLQAKTKPVVFVISCGEIHRHLIESNLFGDFTLRYYGSAAAAQPKFLLEFPRFIILSEDCKGSLEKLVRFRDSSLPNTKLICISSMKGLEAAVKDTVKYEVVEVDEMGAFSCSKVAEILCQASGLQAA